MRVSTLLQPTGPLPPRVYWVRRLVVLVLLVLLVLAIGWTWSLLTGDDDPASTTPGPSGSATPTPSPSASATPTKTPKPTASADPTASPTPTATPGPKPSTATGDLTDCPDSSVSVVMTTDEAAYEPGRLPQFMVAVTNTGTEACQRDVGQAALEVRVLTGDDTLVWSSDHCSPGGPSKILDFQPGDSYTTSLTWSRKSSNVGCTKQAAVDPGKYRVRGRNLDLVGPSTRFRLN